MINYRISGGDNEIIDFKKELMDINLDNSDDYCLISNIKLEPNHVKLDCGHKFNYNALYNDIINSKIKGSMMDYRLQLFQIQCPYCRNIQNTLFSKSSRKTTVFSKIPWILVVSMTSAGSLGFVNAAAQTNSR